jgi:three-Cys-motif partner protein
VPTPDDVVWPCDPHTIAKHQILRTYLETWLPTILQGRSDRVTYAEGFAGSGIYEGGEPGSPIIALRAFARHQTLLRQGGKRVDMVLVEKDHRRVARLQQEITNAAQPLRPIPQGLGKPLVVQGDHDTTLLPKLAETGALKHPVFAFLDSFGGPDVPLDTARAIAQAPAGEVFITFGPRFLIRFGEKPEHRDKGDRAFGNTRWRAVFDLPPDEKKAFLVTSYRQALMDAGYTYVTSFEMLDEGGRDLHLVHATRHLEGLKKMKTAMWQVDKIQGLRFRDPANADQFALDLFLEPDFAPLRRELLAQLRDGPQRVSTLQDYTVTQTIYRHQHAYPLIRTMLKDGLIHKLGDAPLSSDSIVEAGSAPDQHRLL